MLIVFDAVFKCSFAPACLGTSMDRLLVLIDCSLAWCFANSQLAHCIDNFFDRCNICELESI